MYAPVPAQTKLEELKKINEDATERNERELIDESSKGIKNLEIAMRHLDADGVFSLEVCEFDDREKNSTDSFEGVFASINDVWEHVKYYQKISEEKPGDLRWYEASKWEKNAEGKLISVCSYIIVGDEIIFTQIEDKNPEIDVIEAYDYYWGENLNFPVPFKAGDLLQFDGVPFGPKCHVLIVDIGGNNDCCCVQGLALDEEGKWAYGAVKHGMVSFSYFPKISYLYRARLYDGELDEKEKILLEIRDFIGGDEKKGKWFYDKICFCDITEESLLEILKEGKSGIGSV